MHRTLRTTTLTLLACLGMAALFTLTAAAQTPAPQPPAPAPAAPCTILGVPSRAEAGTAVDFTITVRDGKNQPIAGAEVRLGTSISGTTGNDGKHDVTASCGAANSTIEVNVYVNGKLCGTKTIKCLKKDKSGKWIIDAAQVASLGTQTIGTGNLLASQNDLTFDGVTFPGPNVTDLAIVLDVSETSSGRLYAEIVSYNATYEDFSAAGFNFGQTTVVLKDGDANYLSIDQDTGEVTGFLQTLIYNEVVDGLERHLHLTGTFDGEILDIDVAGFLTETGPSPMIWNADQAQTIEKR